MNILLLFFIPSFVFASLETYDFNNSVDSVNYLKAQEVHLPYLLSIIEKIPFGSDDRKKIVVLPEQFRSNTYLHDIEQGKFFLAMLNGNHCIGYKKFFFIPKEQLHDVLENEIRCIGSKCQPVDCYILKQECSEIVRLKTALPYTLTIDFFNEHPTFYTGADYVEPSFRSQGICTRLYEVSLYHVFNQYKDILTNAKYVSIVYGLAQDNDYSFDGSGKSRTSSIAKELIKAFLEQHIIVYSIIVARYKAYMPRFDDEGNILSDEQSVPGYGNCLIFGLSSLKKDLQ